MKKRGYIIFLFCTIFLCQKSTAQRIPASDKITPHSSLTLEDKVNKSDLVIEGIVINEPRWTGSFLLDPNGNRVFSSIIIRVSRVFKGEIKDSIIELITDGGTFPSGVNKGVTSPSSWGYLGKDQEGIFFLRINDSNIQSGKRVQSFLFLYSHSYIGYSSNPYHSIYEEAYYEGKRITDFDKGFYQPIEAITGKPAKVVGLNSFEAAKQKQSK